jgi:dihydroxyacetone kinase
MEFQTLVNLGRATSTHMASVCAALDHCHVPGRTGEWQIPEGRMEIGLGLHNETVSISFVETKVGADDKGVFNIPQPSGEELITRLLDLILKQDDPERSFVKFKDGDDLVLLVNNQGGMSALEMGAVVDETLTQLGMSSFPCFLATPLPIRFSPYPTRSCTRYRSTDIQKPET